MSALAGGSQEPLEERAILWGGREVWGGAGGVGGRGEGCGRKRASCFQKLKKGSQLLGVNGPAQASIVAETPVSSETAPC